MKSTSFPITAAEIDPEWLSRALEPQHPGVRVAEISLVDQTELTNSHARLRIRYDESAGAPDAMFCKMLPADPRRRALIAQTAMGAQEVRFYREIAPQVELRVPAPYVALHDQQDEAFVLLLEDLISSGCSVSDGTRGLSPDATARALEDLADLHTRFSDPVLRRAYASWVHEPMESDYGSAMLRYGLDHHRGRLSRCFVELAELYIEHRPLLHTLWHQGPHTVIHGDPHIGNLFDDAGRTGFLDWGIINTSTPLRDVSYLLVMAMSVEDRREHERALLRHYLDVQRAKGGPEIDFDSAWISHRLHAAYTVPACCQIVTFPEHATEARRTFEGAFLARAEAAVEDLEVRDVLRSIGGL
jgi:aminoglycoside phosphotransferase (APT) family kinase protein